MNQTVDNNWIPIVSAIISVISVIITGLVATNKLRTESNSALRSSDREQNVQLVKDLRDSKEDSDKRFNDLYDKYEDIHATNAKFISEISALQHQRNNWQLERESWQKEREAWQKERVIFDNERETWRKKQEQWEKERRELLARITELERKIGDL